MEAGLREICPVSTPCVAPKGYVARDLHALAAARDEDVAALRSLLAAPAQRMETCELTGRYVPTASTAAPDDAEEGATPPTCRPPPCGVSARRPLVPPGVRRCSAVDEGRQRVSVPSEPQDTRHRNALYHQKDGPPAWVDGGA